MLSFSPKTVVSFLTCGLLVLLAFQNCAKTQFTYEEPSLEQKSETPEDVQDQSDDLDDTLITCKFNGQILPTGTSVSAFQNSSATFGSKCVSETRVCRNGELSGSFAFASCQVGAAQACLFNGRTIAHGSQVTAFQDSSVAFGNSCQQQTRVCNNGLLSGSYTYATCSVGQARSCLFNGRTIAHLESAPAYQNSNVAFGTACVKENRICNNGTLSGQYQYASCTEGTAASCRFNGQDIAHGSSVKAYETSTVAFGRTCASQSRICSNGALSGNYLYSSCSVEQAKSCLVNGKTVNHGETVFGYSRNQVGYGQSCDSFKVARTCHNGFLTGDEQAIYGSCVVGGPQACYLNGRTIPHGDRITAFRNAVVPFGGQCQSEIRVCNNGQLSGSNMLTECIVENPQRCSFQGQSLDHGASIVTFKEATIPFGSQCQSEERRCQNGQLLGSFTQTQCQVLTPATPVSPVTPVTPSIPVSPGQPETASTQDICGSIVESFTARQAVTRHSKELRPAFLTQRVQKESFCGDNGLESIPVEQRSVAFIETNTAHRVCMYPGLPLWYDGGRWVGMNYFTSQGMNFLVAGSYKIVSVRNMNYPHGFETIRQFANRHGLTFIQAPGENFNVDNLWVCKPAPVTGGGGGTSSLNKNMLK